MKTLRKPVFLGAIITISLLAVMIFGYQSVKTWSYGKLQPYALTASVLSKSDASLHVQYNYGYGYLPEHRQTISIVGDSDIQKIPLSISAWKEVRSVQLVASPESMIEALEVTVQQGSSDYNISVKPKNEDDASVVHEVSLIDAGGAQ